jgi:hypothetical protein
VIRVLLAREPIWFGHRHSGRIRARIAQRYRNECHCFPGGSILRVEGMFSCASDRSLSVNYLQGGLNNFVSTRTFGEDFGAQSVQRRGS